MLKPILKFAFILFLVDIVYLYSLKTLHVSVIERVQKSPFQPRLQYGILFYLIASIVWYNLVWKKSGSVKDAALLGLGMYATYDVTLLTLFKDYPAPYALLDIAWGTFALGLSNALFNTLA